MGRLPLLAVLALGACAPPEVPYYEAVAPTQPTRMPGSRHQDDPGASGQGGDAAPREVEVTMYMTSWCPYCRKARRWLQQNGYRYAELDIERDPQAAAELDALNPWGSVPTFDVDGYIVRGFRPHELRSAIRRAGGR
jgi:glutaredoxin